MAASKKPKAPAEPVSFPDDELRRRVAHNLARLLELRGMDARALAIAIGWVDPTPANGASNVRKYLRGEKWPREETLLAWSVALAVDPNEFTKPL